MLKSLKKSMERLSNKANNKIEKKKAQISKPKQTRDNKILMVSIKRKNRKRRLKKRVSQVQRKKFLKSPAK